MFVNRLSAHRLPDIQPRQIPVVGGHEAVEVSFCDEGMCFLSHVKHEVGAVLLVDFASETELTPEVGGMLQSEGIVVDCTACGQQQGNYKITVLFVAE